MQSARKKTRKVRNRYLRNAKRGERIFLKALQCFANDETAMATARKTGISVRTINEWFVQIRRRLALEILRKPTAFADAGATLKAIAVNGNGDFSFLYVCSAIKRQPNQEAAEELKLRLMQRRIRRRDAHWHAIEVFVRERMRRINRDGILEAVEGDGEWASLRGDDFEKRFQEVFFSKVNHSAAFFRELREMLRREPL